MKHLFQCLTPWTHDFGWPHHGIQTCIQCGKEKPSTIDFPVNPKFDVPRSTAVAKEGIPQVVSIVRKRKNVLQR